ncbi:TPA: hypothetical protein ACJ3EQ_002189 [Neisseria meningitidis]|nr:hypothetical protein [Neisseria meningitidis]MBG9009268.1 hypothetical protein [Neisseria meningitidis]MBG9065752.1 hypothetical protein [Neisseria meningitidis]MBG9073734.1 hypothetical protein [Neisseria meningitidis]MBG9074915.1 hypothetical protein [Neisseria meningitidis]MBG9077882.1 hypothetical protein [Neisseria meningitidis]
MPSEPSDGIFYTIPTVSHHSRYTVISKPVIPAQAGIQTPDAAGIYRK